MPFLFLFLMQGTQESRTLDEPNLHFCWNWESRDLDFILKAKFFSLCRKHLNSIWFYFSLFSLFSFFFSSFSPFFPSFPPPNLFLSFPSFQFSFLTYVSVAWSIPEYFGKWTLLKGKCYFYYKNVI